jgi:stage V sporulation protein SpoVS
MKRFFKTAAAAIVTVSALVSVACADVIAEPEPVEVTGVGTGMVIACVAAVAVIIGCIVASVAILQHFMNK